MVCGILVICQRHGKFNLLWVTVFLLFIYFLTGWVTLFFLFIRTRFFLGGGGIGIRTSFESEKNQIIRLRFKKLETPFTQES